MYIGDKNVRMHPRPGICVDQQGPQHGTPDNDRKPKLDRTRAGMPSKQGESELTNVVPMLRLMRARWCLHLRLLKVGLHLAGDPLLIVF